MGWRQRSGAAAVFGVLVAVLIFAQTAPAQDAATRPGDPEEREDGHQNEAFSRRVGSNYQHFEEEDAPASSPEFPPLSQSCLPRMSLIHAQRRRPVSRQAPISALYRSFLRRPASRSGPRDPGDSAGGAKRLCPYRRATGKARQSRRELNLPYVSGLGRPHYTSATQTQSARAPTPGFGLRTARRSQAGATRSGAQPSIRIGTRKACNTCEVTINGIIQYPTYSI